MPQRCVAIAFLSGAALAFTLAAAATARADEPTSVHQGPNERRILRHEPMRPLISERARPGRSSAADPAPPTALAFNAFQRRFEVVLEPNDQLLAGWSEAARSQLEGVRVYRGELAGTPGSWVRLVERDGGWTGMIWDGVELYAIDRTRDLGDTLADVTEGEANVVYRMADVEHAEPTHCGVDPDAPRMEEGDERPSRYGALREELSSLQALTATAGSLLEVSVVADADYVAIHGSESAAAVVARMNIVDGIFAEQVDVTLRLAEIQTLASNGSLTATGASALLSQFSIFTNQGNVSNPGLAHLFTGRNLSGSTVGIAYLGTLCSRAFGVGLSETRFGGTSGSLTIAHEIGHNFDAPHDNQSGSPCAGTPGNFLMNPSLNGSDDFSSCSLQQMAPEIAGASCVVPLPEPPGVISLALGAAALGFLARSRRA
ncbi:MAG: zinc-dependent metalloprotease [Myxococcota bacterium]